MTNHLIPENFDFSPSGPLNPLFLYADNVRLSEIGGGSACSEAERHRLVKASKSPTEQEILDEAYKRHRFEFGSLKLKHCEPSIDCAEIHEYEQPRTKTPINALGCKTVVEFRDWQEAWRVRTEAECISGTAPPQQSGLRESDMLTARGASKIAESCEYMHEKHGGFKTFVTGTFCEEARKRIASSETSIQKEVSRTMDSLQKMYQRGWTKENGERVAGHDHGLPYLWVVEVPENDNGEPNPHIHMLLGWRVEYKDFQDWSKRIESIWQNGYFHLEKIKDSACAGAYMAKAAGYLCKAQDKDDQGTVQGNRYGISKTARAPSWVVIGYNQLHAMGQLIFDIYDHLTVKFGDKYRERKKLNEKLSNTPKTEKGLRKKIGERLVKVRKDLNDIPIRCNKYQVVIKGKGPAFSFFNWLKTPTSEGSVCEEWLPEKPEGWVWHEGPKPEAKNSQFFSGLYKKFERNRFWRRLVPPPRMAETDTNEYWHSVKGDYEKEMDNEPFPYAPSNEQLFSLGYT